MSVGNIPQNNSTIHVVFSSDDDYFVPTYIAIFSLLSNYKGTRNIIIYILCNGDYERKYTIYLKELKNVATEFRLSFVFIDMGNRYQNVRICNNRISISTMYRLSIPNLLIDVSRCIYLDSDIIVEGDISELYDVDLEKKLIAGVKDIYISEKDRNRICTVLAISDMDHYFNAGVLLMDLDGIRKQHLDEKMELIGLSSDDYPYNDQDVMNSLFCENVKMLSPRFNLPIAYINRVENIRHISEYTISEQNPLIIHYISGIKPWKYPESIGARYWWNYIKRINDNFNHSIVDEFIYVEKKESFRRIKEFIISILIKTRILIPIKKLLRACLT